MFSEGKQTKHKNYLHLPIPVFLTEEQRKTLESKQFQDVMSNLAYFLLTKTIPPTLQNAPVYFGGVPINTVSVVNALTATQQPVTMEDSEIKTEESTEIKRKSKGRSIPRNP